MQKILVVDDYPDILSLVRTWLSGEFEVKTARNSSEAVGLMKENIFAAALIDVNLAEKGLEGFGPDGIAVAQTLRDLDLQTAIILFTADPDNYRNLGLHFDDHLAKPVDSYHMIALIRNAIYLRGMSRENRLRRLNCFGDLLMHKACISDFYRFVAGIYGQGDVERLTGKWRRDGLSVAWVVYNLPQHGSDSFTVGVASTAGCGFKCKFCLSGSKPTVRNLDWTEIICQVLYGLDSFHARGIFENPKQLQPCVNFTCEGEPFMNFENVVKAIQALVNIKELGFQFIITSIGLEQGLKDFLERCVGIPGIRHYWSVNSCNPKNRETLMPSTKGHNIVALRDLYQAIAEKTGLPVTASFVFIPGLNDTDADVRAIVRLFGNGRPFQVKIQAYQSPKDFRCFQTATPSQLERFRQKLTKKGVDCRVRETVGGESFAGCGTTVSSFYPQND